MVHPSSHKNTHGINGAVFIFGKIWICLACLLRPDIWSVEICEDSIVFSSGSLTVISFDIITGGIIVVDCFSRCIFALESAISIILLPGEIGGVPIQFIKLILGLLIHYFP